MPISAAGADLAFMLRDCGELAVAPGGEFYGILDRSQVMGGPDGMQVERWATTFVCATADVDVASVAVDTTLVVGASSYQVRDVIAQDDGATVTLVLARKGAA